jgi:hypothetical protein
MFYLSYPFFIGTENPNGAHWGPQAERMKKIFVQKEKKILKK